MLVTISMSGPHLNVYDFLLKATYFPMDYTIWEDVELMKQYAPGCTLHFCMDEEWPNIPVSLGKFLLANKELLQDETIIGKGTIKEISIETRLEKNFEHRLIFTISSAFIKLLGELNFEIYLTKLEDG